MVNMRKTERTGNEKTNKKQAFSRISSILGDAVQGTIFFEVMVPGPEPKFKRMSEAGISDILGIKAPKRQHPGTENLGREKDLSE
jgi:hypothetical protein